MTLDPNGLEAGARAIAADILGRIQDRRPDNYERALREDPLVLWTERGPEFLGRVFRFIDAYPAVAGDDRRLLDYAVAYVGEAAELLGGPGASPQGRAAGVRSLVRGLQRRFTAGERRDEALDVAARLHRDGMGTTLDVLGEQVTSEPEADRYLQAFVDLLRDGARAMRGWEASPRVDRSAYGPRARLNVSIKLSSLYSRFDPIDQEGSFEGVAPRLRALLRAARENGAAVRVDVEHYAVKGLTLDIFRRVLTEEEFRDWPNVGITIQTYLPENRRDFEKLAAWAEARGTPVGVRIVKGAYWDHEVQHARYRNWPLPVYQSKEQTDADFEAACLFVLEHSDCLRPAVASHNVRSVALAIAATQALGLPPDLVEFQTLYGLGDELKAVLVEMGLRMRVYVPFGELVPGTAYLVRRLLEATSRSAFLRQMWPATLPVDELIRAPSPPARRPAIPPSQDLDSPFRNEPVTDFSTAAAREQMARALEDVRRRLGRTYALRIDGKDVSGEDYLISVNPGMTSEVVGRVAAATPSQADVAVEAASRAFPAWAATPACDRAALLLRVADGVCQARFELAAWEAMEVGKSWREADADVAEAVDYLRFYAREAVRLDEPRRRDVHGEDNVYVYRPRGVAVAITPWNFPLAILTGATSAAVAAGNAVIMKPAGQSSVVAARFMDLWQEAGAPPGVVQYLPGKGRQVGEHLVRHRGVHVIAFTGSREVGLRILRVAAEGEQAHVKRVIAEMGGKNAIIVDDDADLDQAVPGVLESAFGYQGQKCSACSRVVAHRDVYRPFMERLVAATRSLPLGPAWDPHFAVGPLVDEAAVEKFRRYLGIGRDTANVACEIDSGSLRKQGYYVGPVILADVDPASRVAQEEIFGPLLCVIPAGDFEHALRVANATDYGLTAGLYSRNPDHIRRFGEEMLAGNLYVNRKVTGALVDRQPFGGLKLSGIGSKAGGPDYLLQFMQPKTVTEYTVRRGFAAPPRSSGGSPEGNES